MISELMVCNAVIKCDLQISLKNACANSCSPNEIQMGPKETQITADDEIYAKISFPPPPPPRKN
jgi:hypothetical protein